MARTNDEAQAQDGTLPPADLARTEHMTRLQQRDPLEHGRDREAEKATPEPEAQHQEHENFLASGSDPRAHLESQAAFERSAPERARIAEQQLAEREEQGRELGHADIEREMGMRQKELDDLLKREEGTQAARGSETEVSTNGQHAPDGDLRALVEREQAYTALDEGVGEAYQDQRTSQGSWEEVAKAEAELEEFREQHGITGSVDEMREQIAQRMDGMSGEELARFEQANPDHYQTSLEIYSDARPGQQDFREHPEGRREEYAGPRSGWEEDHGRDAEVESAREKAEQYERTTATEKEIKATQKELGEARMEYPPNQAGVEAAQSKLAELRDQQQSQTQQWGPQDQLQKQALEQYDKLNEAQQSQMQEQYPQQYDTMQQLEAQRQQAERTPEPAPEPAMSY